MLIKKLTIIGIAREEAGIERKQLTHDLPITPSQLQAWESGRVTPRKFYVESICDYLKDKISLKTLKELQKYIETLPNVIGWKLYNNKKQ